MSEESLERRLCANNALYVAGAGICAYVCGSEAGAVVQQFNHVLNAPNSYLPAELSLLGIQGFFAAYSGLLSGLLGYYGLAPKPKAKA